MRLSVQVAILGLVVGTFVGLSGVGAGTLMAPALILLGIHPSIAVGTDLAYSSVTKLVGSARNAAHQLIDRPWLLWASVGGLPGTVAGAEVTRLLPSGPGVEHFLKVAVAAALIVASLAIVVKDLATGRGSVPRRDLARARPAAVAGIGAVIGLLVGLTSIGSGSLFMTCLLMYSTLELQEAVATDIANAAVVTLPAALLHWAGGSVNLALAGNLLVGSVPGVLLGARLAQRVPARPLKYGVALLVLAGGLKMML